MITNLFQHADGGFYCLLADDAPMKCPTTDAWRKGVIYTSTDGKLRSTTLERWKTRFTPVAEYTGDDEQVLMMIRRTNPGNQDFDFVRVFESWHESEINITGQMLELAVAATSEIFVHALGGARDPAKLECPDDDSVQITLMTEDLQRIAQTYEIERVPIPHGFTFVMRKSHA